MLIIDSYAIKAIDGIFGSRAFAKRVLREISIMRQLNHKNICSLKYINNYTFFRRVFIQPENESFDSLWMVQVLLKNQKVGLWRMGSVKNSEKCKIILYLDRKTREICALPITMRSTIPSKCQDSAQRLETFQHTYDGADQDNHN